MLRRLSAATMAAVNGHFAETILGVATIRDYNLQAKESLNYYIFKRKW